MRKPKLLDLFCGAGGATKGYQRAGFYVVGVDIKPQPHYCGDEFYQADALEFPLDEYDTYHASPPCQAYSVAFSMLLGYRKEHPDLLGKTRDYLLRTNKPFVLEYVPRSPMFDYIKLNGTMFGLKAKKERLFELHGFDILLLPAPYHKTAGMVRDGKLLGQIEHVRYKNAIRPTKEAYAAAYKIDWFCTRNELRQAIPPAYTEYIGKYLMETIRLGDDDER